MLIFNKKYFLVAVILFALEVLIALFVNDNFIRPSMGDILVVALIYCFLKIFFDSPSWIIALITLVFSVLVETLQYFHIVERFGLENNLLARIVIGTTFSWKDIILYVIGITIILFVEHIISRKNKGYT